MNKLWIGGALLATLAAVYFAPDPDADSDSVSEPVRRSSAPAAALTTAGSTESSGAATLPSANGGLDLRIHARDAEADMGNLFGAAQTPPPVVAAAGKAAPEKRRRGAPPPPTKPQAPPLPFEYRGRWAGEASVAYFLQWNDRNLVLHVGDSVDNTYKLEQAGAGQLTFVYLPLNQKQSLAVGDVN